MTYFKNNIALLFGVKSAVIAQYLWDSLYIKGTCESIKRENRCWCRCSVIRLTSEFPYYSRHQISDAIEILLKNKVISKADFNNSKFDHTNWYSFTEYGISLMIKNNGGFI